MPRLNGVCQGRGRVMTALDAAPHAESRPRRLRMRLLGERQWWSQSEVSESLEAE